MENLKFRRENILEEYRIINNEYYKLLIYHNDDKLISSFTTAKRKNGFYIDIYKCFLKDDNGQQIIKPRYGTKVSCLLVSTEAIKSEIKQEEKLFELRQQALDMVDAKLIGELIKAIVEYDYKENENEQ